MILETPIVDRMRAVVTATEVAILPYLQTIDDKIVQVHYEHGHPLEIVNTLLEMNKPQVEQFKKYPLIALFEDITEDMGAVDPGTARLQVVIAMHGELVMKSAERYQLNFNRILLPLYHEFIKQYKAHFASRAQHTRIIHPYWGREGLYGNTANQFADALDCIELRNLETPLRRAHCTPASFKNF